MAIQKLKYGSLLPEMAELVEMAKDAALSAYAPYSHFRVGAAVIMSDGTLFCGSNQENAAYGQAICAERVALLYALANKPAERPLMLAIAAIAPDGSFTPEPVTPCGACRQVLAETVQRCGADFEIIMYGEESCLVAQSANDLLPYGFSSQDIK